MATDNVTGLDPEQVDSWGDPAKHPETSMSPEEVRAHLEAGREMFMSHLTRDGFPMVTVQFYCLVDGEIWSTTVRGRVKAKALRRDPRTCLCISNGSRSVAEVKAVSIKARAEVIEDRAVVERVCRAHAERYFTDERAREAFFRTLFTPNRLAIRFVPEKVISWDSTKTQKGR